MDAIKSIQILIHLLQLMLQIFYCFCQSVYYNCFGSKEKDVTDEIVLVRKILCAIYNINVDDIRNIIQFIKNIV